MAKRPGKQIAEATAEPLTKGGDTAEKIVKGNAEALTVSGNASRARCSGADQGVSGIGDQECQEPDRCDAGAGRSEKPGGVPRIATAANQGRGRSRCQ